MHGGANTLHPAMHGGGVGPPRDVHGDEAADVYPAMDHGGLRVPRHRSWRVRTSCVAMHGTNPTSVWPCLLPPKNPKKFKIPHYIEFLNVYMEY